ncbi:MAG: hypothetical protein SFX73_15520 [Kofleriaceae bacterium]|nr:hypothetical protein [Kofleriaceae bacterium]
MKTTSMLAALSLVALATEVAHADDDVIGAASLAVQAAPLVMGVADLVGHDGGKGYGVAEIAFGGTAAAMNLRALALLSSEGGPSGAEVAVFGGAAVIDAAVMVHGLYLVTREETPSPLQVKAGSLRGTFAPTLVSNGKASAPGLGLGGTF